MKKLNIKFVGKSVKTGGYRYWQTEVSPLAEGINRSSSLGMELGLAMSCTKGDEVIYTLNKVN
jgi:hypothetical protein